jgi:UDP-glucose 4-epimerase
LTAGDLTAEVLNVGRGVGVSVREMVDAVGRALGRPLPYVVDPRRPGDPAEVVASAERIRARLGWRSRYDLDAIVESATPRVPAHD